MLQRPRALASSSRPRRRRRGRTRNCVAAAARRDRDAVRRAARGRAAAGCRRAGTRSAAAGSPRAAGEPAGRSSSATMRSIGRVEDLARPRRSERDSPRSTCDRTCPPRPSRRRRPRRGSSPTRSRSNIVAIARFASAQRRDAVVEQSVGELFHPRPRSAPVDPRHEPRASPRSLGRPLPAARDRLRMKRGSRSSNSRAHRATHRASACGSGSTMRAPKRSVWVLSMSCQSMRPASRRAVG